MSDQILHLNDKFTIRNKKQGFATYLLAKDFLVNSNVILYKLIISKGLAFNIVLATSLLLSSLVGCSALPRNAVIARREC
jgi:hypothetical protein